MASAAAHIWNNTTPSAIPLAAKPQSGAAAGNSGDASSTTSANISANDFLTLLVTELQNQDPTAQTDPNAYVNQLVAVNSLEQLININQTLGSAVGSAPSGATPGMAAHHIAAPTAVRAAQSHQAAPAAAPSVPHAPGNLAIPHGNPAADRVAQALNTHAR